MNSALIGGVALVWLYIAYRIYSRHLEKKLVEPIDQNPTPAVALEDDIDYKPTRPIILFGHHFSSIAGAGPILGPVIAATFFGWGGAALWILLGVVFLGAVHDYLALVLSVRHRGRSIPDIAREVVGQRSRLLFMVFVWLALVLVIAAFADVAADTLIAKPELVIPTFGLIPVAMLFGHVVYGRQLNVVAGTVGSLVVLGLLIYVGALCPIGLQALDEGAFPHAAVVLSIGTPVSWVKPVWLVALVGYGYVASVLPVWLLLQPRDYIANWVLIVGMVLGFTGLFWTHPDISAPFFTGVVSQGGLPMWPMLFIIVACGALSGFHALVASGTTAKQLAREKHARLIGYGSMITEGALAILALMCVVAGLAWEGAGSLRAIMSVKVGGGAIVAFGQGFGRFVAPLVGLSFGVLVGATIINTFVMTTLDTAVRLTRFITTELGGEHLPLLKNRFVASAVAAAPAFAFVATGTREVLWPMFGTANQLVAALTLIVITAYLVGIRKPSYYTLIPAILALATTVGALVWQGWRFFFPPRGAPNYLLGGVAVFLLALAVLVAADAFPILLRNLRPKLPRPASR